MHKQIIDLREKLLKVFEQIVTSLANAIKSWSRSNAFAPYIVFSSTTLLFVLVICCFVKDVWIQRILIGCACFVIILGPVFYFLLFLKDPKLLQSERFRLEDKKLDVVASKATGIEIATVDWNKPVAIDKGGEHE